MGELLYSRPPRAAFELYYLSLSVTGPRREGKTRENKSHPLLFFHTPAHSTDRETSVLSVSVSFNWSVSVGSITSLTVHCLDGTLKMKIISIKFEL